jgi:hypothetical protein
MIRVKEKTILCIVDFHPDNSAMEFAFIQDFLEERWTARRKSRTSFEFDFPFPGVDEIQDLIKSIEIYIEAKRDTILLYYFMPTGINGKFNYFHTTIGKAYGENSDSNILGL